MMKLLLLSLVVLLGAEASPDQLKKIMKTMNVYNLRTKCWGESNTNNYQVSIMKAQETCMQLAPSFDLLQKLQPLNNPFTTLPGAASSPFQKLQSFQNLNQLSSLWRSKRQASSGLLNPDESDFVDFLEDFGDYKENMASKMGNLTCVLKEMKLLTPDLKINTEQYEKPLSEMEGFNVEESFAKDPEWAKKLAEGYSDCYKISQNFPQSALNRNPLKKIFGRNMIFFKCADKNEKKMCTQGVMLNWLETIYGSDDGNKPEEYGLPEDKYEAAAVSVMVLNNAASPEEEFVGDFFWGGMGH